MTPRPPQRGRSGRSRSGPRRKTAQPAVEPLHPTSTPPEVESFDDFTLDPAVQEAIRAMGITVPTPIQALAIQPVLDGRDVIAQAETGTGKTLAFGAPMISKVDTERVSVLGLVLCPTRELAEQVAKVLEELGKARGARVVLIVGGEPAGPQVQALKEGAQVVVGTPGRVLDLYGQGFLSFPWTEFAILDEADEMLEIGFIDDVKQILKYTPDERQTLLFSATFPPELLRLAREHTRDPVEIATASGVATVDNITQDFFEIDEDDRPLALIRLIEQSDEDDIFLVFCERRTEVERLMRRLERLPFSVKALHGGYDQASRFRVMSAFREKAVKALVATDVASRGLDVAHVTRVVNFSVPRDVTAYTHRIGRTGRAGREGCATTFVTPRTETRWRSILRSATWEIPQSERPGRGRRREPERPRRAPREEGREERVHEVAPPRHDGPRSRREREERPARERDERPTRERGERPTREREERPARERGERPTRERGERPAREREERPVRERGERPTRERGERSTREREDRPARERGEERSPTRSRRRSEQEESPRRASKEPRREGPRREERRPQASEEAPPRVRSRRAERDSSERNGRNTGGGFGAGLEPEPERAPERPPSRPKRKPRDERREQAAPAPTEAPRPSGTSGGFGAGL